jgi:hypothetical protein
MPPVTHRATPLVPARPSDRAGLIRAQFTMCCAGFMPGQICAGFRTGR